MAKQQEAGEHEDRQYRRRTLIDVAALRLFASARQAAGTGADRFDGATVGDVIAAAVAKFGPGFAAVVPNCRVWVNGEPAESSVAVTDADEVALLPPVSGG
jgi:sulfur-carrier protein